MVRCTGGIHIYRGMCRHMGVYRCRGCTDIWDVQGIYSCTGAYRHIEAYRSTGWHIDVWGHIDIQVVYRHVGAYRCTGGHTDVWGMQTCGGIQMYRGHMDIWGHTYLWGSYGHPPDIQTARHTPTCLPTTPEALYGS